MIGVTGATGHFGPLVVQSLMTGGVAAEEIVALVRSPAKARDLAGHGVSVRRADYSEPDTLSEAFSGVDRLLLVSSSEVGQRVAQHRNVIDAAVAAGVEMLAYTSILHADSSGMQLATEHRATEEMIRESGLPAVLLRNGWYIENYTATLDQTLEHGALIGAADEGRVSAATRADFAAAAAAVLTDGGHEGAVYELGGDEAFTMDELAAEIARQSGRPVEYRNLTETEYAAALVDAGVPEAYARVLADSDRGVARGELFTDSGDLRRLIGRPTTPIASAISDALGE